ncbi:hypothetical protein GCM10025794_35720 [Massilia kyonggiensis]
MFFPVSLKWDQDNYYLTSKRYPFKMASVYGTQQNGQGEVGKQHCYAIGSIKSNRLVICLADRHRTIQEKYGVKKRYICNGRGLSQYPGQLKGDIFVNCYSLEDPG